MAAILVWKGALLRGWRLRRFCDGLIQIRAFRHLLLEGLIGLMATLDADLEVFATFDELGIIKLWSGCCMANGQSAA